MRHGKCYEKIELKKVHNNTVTINDWKIYWYLFIFYIILILPPFVYFFYYILYFIFDIINENSTTRKDSINR